MSILSMSIINTKFERSAFSVKKVLEVLVICKINIKMRTSATQFSIMVDFMEGNGDLSKPQGGPRGRQWAAMKWRELTVKLNSDGSGESRSEDKWRKVWTDFKNNTKRKKAKLNRSMTSTGGGPALKISLTDLELRVLNIIGEQAATGMTTVPEVGFEHAEQEVVLELESPDVGSNPMEVPDVMDLGPEPSPNLDRQGVEDWNHPRRSPEQPSLIPPLAPAVAPSVAPTKKWTPRPKRAQHKDYAEVFLTAENNRDNRYYELERERLRQRDVELDLQSQWIAFMNAALSALMKFLEEKKKDE